MSNANDPELTQAPARKALGQHFLFDPNILHRAATAAGSPAGRTVIEVGPGPGGLTRAILKEGATKLIAVEADPRFAAALLDWPEAKDSRLVVIEKDARKVRWEKVLEELGAETPAMIIANLPYNVGTVLLIDWLKAGACAVGVGGALLDKQAIADGNFAKLTENARILRQSIQSVR